MTHWGHTVTPIQYAVISPFCLPSLMRAFSITTFTAIERFGLQEPIQHSHSIASVR